jgi:hypothetical protein
MRLGEQAKVLKDEIRRYVLQQKIFNNYLMRLIADNISR